MLRQRVAKHGRLIVAAHQQPAAVQRYRDNQGIPRQQVTRRLDHHADKDRRRVGPVGMLEREDRPPAAVIIGEHCTRPVKDRRPCRTSGTDCIRPLIVVERQTAAGAAGRGQ